MTPKPAHTPEPWDYSQEPIVAGKVQIVIGGPHGRMAVMVDGVNNLANASRIVSCVNALTGIPDPKAHMEAVEIIIAAGKDIIKSRGCNSVNMALMRCGLDKLAALSKLEAK